VRDDCVVATTGNGQKLFKVGFQDGERGYEFAERSTWIEVREKWMRLEDKPKEEEVDVVAAYWRKVDLYANRYPKLSGAQLRALVSAREPELAAAADVKLTATSTGNHYIDIFQALVRHCMEDEQVPALAGKAKVRAAHPDLAKAAFSDDPEKAFASGVEYEMSQGRSMPEAYNRVADVLPEAADHMALKDLR
jgi:hypothetical protein